MDEIVLDRDLESLAHILTLVMANLNPYIDKGVSYELIINLVAQIVYESIEPEEIEEVAAELSHMVLQTVGAKYLRN